MTLSNSLQALRRPRVPRGILAGATLIFGLGAIAGFVILTNYARINQIQPEFAQARVLLPQITGLRNEVLQLHTETNTILNSDLPDYRKAEALRAELETRLTAVQVAAGDQAQFATAVGSAASLLATWDSQIEILKSGPNIPQRATLTFELNRSFSVTEAALDELYLGEEQSFYVSTAGALAALQNTQVVLLGLGGVIFAAAVVLLIVVRRSVNSQINQAYTRLQAAAQVGRAASSILILDDLMAQVVNLIREGFGFYHVSIFLLDERGERAVLRESTGEAGAALKARRHALAVGSQSLIGWVTAHRRPRVALDVGADPVHFKNELLPETRSELAIPLIIGERLLGAVDVQSRQPDAFSDADIVVLRSLADQVAVAISNAAQYATQQARNEQLSALLDAAVSLAEPQVDLTQLLNAVARRAMHLAGADGVRIWLAAGDAAFELRAAYQGDRPMPVGRRLDDDPALLPALAGGRAVRFAAGEAPAAAELAGLFGGAVFTSAMLAPLNWQGQVMGLLALSRSRPGSAFGDDEQSTTQLFASQVAAAIANQRLLAEMQAELARRGLAEQEIMRRSEELAALTRRERLINDITAKIRRSTDVQTILQTTASELGRAFSAASARVDLRLEPAPAQAVDEPAAPANGNGRHAGNGREGQA